MPSPNENQYTKINYMQISLKQVLIFIFSVFLFSSCEKELSFENTGGAIGGTAVFSLDGGSGNCTGVYINGSYVAGVALGPSNTATLSVNVTTIGTYTITSNTINGIVFSGAGTFTATGVQNITLTGSGTPLTAGSFNFTSGSGGCIFSVSVTSGSGGSGGTATFTLNGAPGNCTTPAISGMYSAGIALDISNIIALQVNVSTIGTYTISTASVNGMIFTGNGTFTNTGAQTIILTGTGVPTAAGDFIFSPGNNGCSFSITVNGSSSSDTGYFYEATIDGIYSKVIVDANSGYSYGSGTSGSGFDSAIISSDISPWANPPAPEKPYLEISKGMIYDWPNATNATIKSFFTIGDVPFATPDYKTGATVGYWDGKGEYWESDNLPGTQVGSSFKITSVEDDTVAFGFYAVRVTFVFNCKVYDTAGNSKTITNGKFIGLFYK
jgi:hypothetical protein